MRKTTNRSALLFSALALTSLLGALSFSSGCASMPESEASYERTAEPVVSKTDWLRNLHSGLTEELCGGDQIFRTCYSVSEQDCRERVNDIAASCESKYQTSVPEVLSDLEGRHWGGRIGRCTGDGLFEAVSANYSFNETDSCNALLSEM